MNETTQAAGNASSAASTSSMLDTASLLTTVHLIWLAIFAAIVVAGIIYGSRIKHRRVAAERRAAEHAAEAGVEAAPADAPDTHEPSAAAPPPAAPPPAAPPPPAPSPAATPASASDDAGPAGGSVTQLKGLGPKVAARLGELGVTTVGQIAALDDDAARRLDDQLGPFRGRLERDRWVEQARFLAAGDRAGFEAVFGKL